MRNGKDHLMRRKPVARPLTPEEVETHRLAHPDAVARAMKVIENFDPENVPRGIKGRELDRFLRDRLEG
jgi:hypothetical protein